MMTIEISGVSTSGTFKSVKYFMYLQDSGLHVQLKFIDGEELCLPIDNEGCVKVRSYD